MRLVGGMQLVHGVLQMKFDGAGVYAQDQADFLIGFAGGQPLQDLAFAEGQFFPALRHKPWRQTLTHGAVREQGQGDHAILLAG